MRLAATRKCIVTSFIVFTAVLVSVASTALAGNLQSGLEPGEELEAFDVEKCAGAVNDGVDVGSTLCYRCRYKARPVVVVFSRKADAQLAKLVKKLDGQVVAHEDDLLSSFVCFLGENPEELKVNAKQFGAKNKVERVALVVPQDCENGPPEYNLNSEAEVTVLLYVNGRVEANHAFAAGKLSDKAIATIVSDTTKILPAKD